MTPTAARASATPEFAPVGLTDSAFALLDPDRYVAQSADYQLVGAPVRTGFEVIKIPNAFQ